MLQIVIIGTGNVASHLFKAISNSKEAKIVQIYGRKQSSLQQFEKKTSVTTDLTNIKEADLYIIAVNDDAVYEVSRLIKNKNGLVVHTSGSVSMDVLQSERKGESFLSNWRKDLCRRSYSF